MTKAINVLVLDDSLVTRKRLKRMIQGLELEASFFEAGNIADALKINESNEIHYATVDINLPDGNGFEFIEKARSVRSDLKCLVISGNRQDPTVESAEQLHVELAFKPLNDEELSAFGDRLKSFFQG